MRIGEFWRIIPFWVSSLIIDSCFTSMYLLLFVISSAFSDRMWIRNVGSQLDSLMCSGLIVAWHRISLFNINVETELLTMLWHSFVGCSNQAWIGFNSLLYKAISKFMEYFNVLMSPGGLDLRYKDWVWFQLTLCLTWGFKVHSSLNLINFPIQNRKNSKRILYISLLWHLLILLVVSNIA